MTTPDPGFELCYECDGARSCWSCGGSGKRQNGDRCNTCVATGRCIVCNGDGQLVAGSRAKHGPSEPAPPRSPPPGKRTAKSVGKLRELGDEDAPTLAEARGTRGDAHLAEVVAYLKAGKLLVMSPGLVDDPLEPTKLAGKRSIRTDGVYAWPDTAAYFVEHYRIALPEEFERHMEERGWKMPAPIDITGLVPD